jgi:hypothetical protein
MWALGKPPLWQRFRPAEVHNAVSHWNPVSARIEAEKPMPQYVIEFGAEKLRFIGAAIEASLAEPHDIAIDSSPDAMSYATTGRGLREVLDDLEEGIAAPAIIRNGDPRIRYALITSPGVHAPQLTLWMER